MSGVLDSGCFRSWLANSASLDAAIIAATFQKDGSLAGLLGTTRLLAEVCRFLER
jgi:hypothetical protein